MRRAVILGMCCLMMAGPVMAQQAKRHQFEFGPEIYYFNYNEPGVMEEDGVFYGLAAAYSYHHGLMLGLDGRFDYGNVDYSGSGDISGINDWAVETRGTAGWDWDVNDRTMLTPFSGFGYRYLNDDTSGKTSSTGALGYERESNYFYTPVGLAMRWAGQQGWGLNISGEYDLFWAGRQISHLSDAVSSLNDLHNKQDGGYGARASVAVEKKGRQTDWVVEAFWRYWNIDQSDNAPVTSSGTLIGFGFEPDNHSYELGGRITARF